MTLTVEELERRMYIDGDHSELVDALGRVLDLQDELGDPDEIVNDARGNSIHAQKLPSKQAAYRVGYNHALTDVQLYAETRLL